MVDILVNKQKELLQHAKIQEDLHSLVLPPEEKKENNLEDTKEGKKKREKPPKGMEMLKLLFPGYDFSQPYDPDAPRPKMVPVSSLPFMQPKLKKPNIQFPKEAEEIINEIRARRQARANGASLLRTGSLDMKNLVCTPEKPPKDGVFQIRTPEGVPVLYVEYKNGKMDGVQKKFLGGILSEIAHYKEGKLDGENCVFNEEKVLVRKFTYKDGKLNGEMIQCDDAGDPLMRSHFLDNQQHGIQVVYTQGNMIARTSFVKGKKQGEMLAFYPPNDPDKPPQVSRRAMFLDDLLQGPVFTYFPNGKVLMEENFLKNKKNGPTIEYFDTGKVRKISVFKDNKLVRKPDEWDYYGKKIDDS